MRDWLVSVAGYTPVFDTAFTGTLCGRWPDTGAWFCLLAIADKNGVIDVTPQYISSVTGMSVDDLLECIDRFMQPDEFSRTKDEDGRRLVAVDPERQWGWKIVNHAKYREKARLQAKNAREVEDGTNKERLQDRRRPPLTAADPLSNANTDTNTDTSPPVSPPSGGSRRKRATRIPDDFELTDERRLVAEAEKQPAERTFAKFRDYWRAASGARARKHDWDATWRNWCRTEADRSRGSNGVTAPRKTKFEEHFGDGGAG